jgi:predicted deacylase
LGDTVEVGEVLGTVTDPLTNERGTVIATIQGRIIGMAVPQVVIPGFAAFHIGVEAPGTLDTEAVDAAVRQPEGAPTPPDELDPEEAPE